MITQWFITLNPNYTSIKEGANKITARLSCLPNVVGNNITKWYSINVAGIATAEANNSTNILPPPSSLIINSDGQVESGNEEQEPPTSDINDKIGDEIKNFKDRIMEQVEKNLREKGIELNLR